MKSVFYFDMLYGTQKPGKCLWWVRLLHRLKMLWPPYRRRVKRFRQFVEPLRHSFMPDLTIEEE